jgi:large subunit ribosomal protein L22
VGEGITSTRSRLQVKFIMKAMLKNYRQTPRKVRLVADLIRGKSVPRALTLLSHVDKRAARPVAQLLNSAVANAESAHSKKKEDLEVKSVRVDKGIAFKRFRARARGHAALIKKQTSHIRLELGDAPAKVEKSEVKTVKKSKKGA